MRLLLLAGLSVLLVGCTTKTHEKTPSPGEKSVSRTATDGPVSVSLIVTPETVDVGKNATVQLKVTAPRGVTVDVDDYRRALLDGDRRFELGVTGTKQEESIAAGDDLLAWRYSYTVAFFLAGSFEFPPAIAHYVDTRNQVPPTSSKDGDAESSTASGNATPTTAAPVDSHDVTTEPITITAVEPAATALTEADLHDIKVLDPVELKRPLTYWAWIAPLVVVLLVVAALLLVRRRRRALAQGEVLIPAHEWAWRQIARLAADDLINKGRVQEFYYRVSDVVRGYVERRFGVCAPEMTTEEFLHASARDARFSVEHRGGVGEFLAACDLVKYARHVPQTTEADELLSAARTFIEQTRERSTMEHRLAANEPQAQERAA